MDIIFAFSPNSYDMEQNGKILIVDDEEDILMSLQLFLSQHFPVVDTEHNPTHIPRRLRKTEYDLVFLDMNFRRGETSGKEGLRWLEKIGELSPTTSVIMITAYADVNVAVEAVKLGAIDFIEKPWRNQKLLATVLSVMQLHNSKKTIAKLKDQQRSLNQSTNATPDTIIGKSAAMQRVFKLIGKVAVTDANVLVLGENGTGKELIAREIHRKSPRREGPFVKVDLGAIADSLFESELFGHKKGAFTDAKQDRMGRFEVASGGTLFLDEIGNLNLPLQSKLLSVLQNRAVIPIGANRPIPIDVRLVCATNMPLAKMIQENTFRQDLLYRINTVEITLPPLRERIQDIPLLVNYFLDLYKKKYQKPTLSITKDTIKQLSAYDWPGNIRELRHAAERAVILCDDEQLTQGDFMMQSNAMSSGDQPEMNTYNLDSLEKWAIQKVLHKHSGNISHAADELGLARATLYRRMKKHGL